MIRPTWKCKRVHQIRIDLVTLCTDNHAHLKHVMLFGSFSNTIIRFCAPVLLPLKQKETDHILRHLGIHVMPF